MLEALHRTCRRTGSNNVTRCSVRPGPALPHGGADLVLIVDTYHHLTERPRYLARLARALSPGGASPIVTSRSGRCPSGRRRR